MMAFVYVMTLNSSVVVGASTKVSDYRTLAYNTDAIRERFVRAHHMNAVGVEGEDGLHKADYTNPTWFYAKNQHGATAAYFCLYLDPRTSNDVRLHLSNTTAAPTAHQGRLIILGTDTAPNLL